MNKSNEIRQAIEARLASKTLRGSLNFLAAQKGFIKSYEDLEQFAFKALDDDKRLASAVEHHLLQVRRIVQQELWRRELFLSINTIEQILYLSVMSDDPPAQAFLKFVFDNGLHYPGFVLYPMHSFGFLAAGLSSVGPARQRVRLDLNSAGISLTPQSGSMEHALAFIDATRMNFGIAHEVSEGDLEHYHRSRGLKWLTNNPLLAVKVASYSSGYYENQRILLLKLRFSSALVAMMAVLGRREAPSSYREFSTSRVNNWATLDIRHYMVFQAKPRSKRLSIDCTPMHLDRVDMIELSDLGVDIDPRIWRGARPRARLEELKAALGFLEQGYLQHCVVGSRDEVSKRLFSKLSNSMDYFRRSLRSRGNFHDNVIALAIAFETLLSDFYAPGVTDRLGKRAAMLLKGIRGVGMYNEAVRNLYMARSEIVHTGQTAHDTNIWPARQAYIHCLLGVVKRLKQLPSVPENPISAILPDQP